jgi:S1-C subfamily serine protease
MSLPDVPLEGDRTPSGSNRHELDARRPRSGATRRLLASLVAAAVVGGLSGGVVARAMAPSSSGTIEGAPTTASGPPGQREPANSVGSVAFPDVPALVSRVSTSIVSIDVTSTTVGFAGQTLRETSAGTGFVIAADGLIATNAHVITNARAITVTMPGGLRVPGTVVGVDVANDLAVLRTAQTKLVPLRFARAAEMRVGAPVVAIGNAFALEGGPTASFGIISAVDRTITTQDGRTYTGLLQTDAAINAGDSGGPLVDERGEVVGVNTAALSGAESIGFAIAATRASTILEHLAGGLAR